MNTLYPITALTPTCCIWVGTNAGNVIMMSMHVKSPATRKQPRTMELTHTGNVFPCVCIMCTVHVM